MSVTGNMCENSCHPALANVGVRLHNQDIWSQFHEHTTEMIITKSGRRMFPYLRLEISGLDPDARYFVFLDFNMSSNKRFKFNGAQWTPIGNAEPQLPPSSRMYVHPDSPAVGTHWMSQSILFNKVKLTNHTLDRAGNLFDSILWTVNCGVMMGQITRNAFEVVLTSMHKYLPCVHVVMASDVLAVHWSPTATFKFTESEFVAVTAYQNEKITKLKIDNNPFAKGFRESGQSRIKRKLYQVKDEIDEKDDCKRTRLSPPLLPLATTPADDSGISSVGSATPPISDSEDLLRINLSNVNQYERTPYYHYPLMPLVHSPWMDVPLPPYPLIPPYCPTLWPYSSLYLPPNPHQLYARTLPFAFMTPPPKETSLNESCLIDLSIKKENVLHK